MRCANPECSKATVSLGISASDFVPARGMIAPEVHDLADHLEYGGYAAPATDPGVAAFRSAFPNRAIGRHLVATELAARLDIADEVRRIRAELDGVSIRYLVTDFGYWHHGGRGLAHLWARPCSLTREIAARVARNATNLQKELGIPVHPENPFVMCHAGDLDVVDFMRELADHGAQLCFDVGHFVSWYRNMRRPLSRAVTRLPLDSIRVMHVAGLSIVEYGQERFWLDNHNVPPESETLDLAHETRHRAPSVSWITYEAELAPTHVQLTGLRVLRRLQV